jgi:hypothetical protein
VNFNARVERFWISENDNPDKLVTIPALACCGGDVPSLTTIVPGSGVPPVSSTGWLFSLAATAHF